jgi:hypothetical protein
MMDAEKGDLYCLTCQELISFQHLPIPAAGIQHIVVWAGSGRMLISANILAFSLIGKTDHIELYKFVFGIRIRYLEARPACVQSSTNILLSFCSCSNLLWPLSSLELSIRNNKIRFMKQFL